MTESDETFIMRGVGAVRDALGSGVTTMRDLGSRNQVVLPIKAAVEDGIIPGPRMIVAGTPITTTGGHCNMFGTEADTADAVVSAIRNQFKLGADCIKIMSTGGGFTPAPRPRSPVPRRDAQGGGLGRRATRAAGGGALPRHRRRQNCINAG